MSVWCQIEIQLCHPKRSRKGIKEIANISLEWTEHSIAIEEISINNNLDYRKFKVSISLCEDGDMAAKKVKQLIEDLRNHNSFQIDCTATIRYLAG